MLKKIKIFCIIFLFNTYKVFFNSMFGMACKHKPSCSEYAKKSLIENNILIGIYLSFKRILSCNPLMDSRYESMSGAIRNER